MVVQEGVGALTKYKTSGMNWEDGRPGRLPQMTRLRRGVMMMPFLLMAARKSTL